MKIIVCVGDNNAMLFHNRRISRDRAVIEDILRMVSKEVKKDGRTRIWMNEYSSELFRTYSGDISVSERFLEEAGEEEYCFVENVPIQEYKDEIQTVVLYRWNRKYPADIRFAAWNFRGILMRKLRRKFMSNKGKHNRRNQDEAMEEK